MMELRREVNAVPLSPCEVDELSIAVSWDWTSGDAISEMTARQGEYLRKLCLYFGS